MVANSRLALAGALFSVAQAHNINWSNTTAGVVYTTEVVTELTTYCPAPTTLTHGDKTYTVTEPTTLTITDCPCTISKPVEPTTTPVHGDECSAKCIKEYRECQTAPNANQSYCASQVSACLGYTPFEDGSFITPTACSDVPETTKPTEPHYTTEVVTHLTTYCPEPTTLTIDSSTYTITEATTLTISDCSCTVSKPVETHPAETTSPAETTKPAPSCPEECMTAYNKCRVAPGSNKSTCASEYASCLGFNPFNNNGTLVTPTACSHGAEPTKPTETHYTTEVVTHLTTYCPEPTTLTIDSSTYTVTEPTTLTISDCSCTVSKPVETHPVHTEPTEPEEPEKTHHVPTEPEEPEETHHVPTEPEEPEQPHPEPSQAPNCPEECLASYRACQTAPNANQSYCAAQIASCLGYSPFEDGSFITPTACSAQPPKTTLEPSATIPVVTPGVPDSPSTIPTAAADHLSPMGALGVIAAFALL